MEFDVIKYNDKEYFLAKKITINNVIYCYFVNVENKYDVFVRKLINENGKEYLVGLEDSKELYFALSKFEEVS